MVSSARSLVPLIFVPFVSSAGIKWDASVAEFATQPDMDVLTGYDFISGVKSPAMETPLPCTDKTGPHEACLFQDEAEGGTLYTREVKSSNSYNSLMKSITKAEGGAFGVTVSTGVTAMKDSSTTESSWTYLVGETVRTKRNYVKNEQYLKLLPGAKTLLQKDPLGFLNRYGQHYAYSITYGGSFLGYCTLTESHSASTSDLDVFVEVQAHVLFFQAKASEDYSTKTSQTSSRLSSYCYMKWRGGTGIKAQGSPKDIGDAFAKWQNTVRDHPKALVMNVRTWIDSDEVAAIVNTFSPEIQQAFVVQPITDVTSERLSEEEAQLLLTQQSIQAALLWSAVTLNSSFFRSFLDLKDQCDAHAIDLNTLGEDGVIARQDEMKNQNFSWFVARRQFDEFTSIKAEVPALVNAFYGIKAYNQGDPFSGEKRNVGHVYRSSVSSISHDAGEEMTRTSYRSMAIGPDGYFYGVGGDMKIWRILLSKIRNAEEGWEQVGTSDHNVFVSITGNTVWAGCDPNRTKEWYDSNHPQYGTDYGGDLWRVDLSNIMKGDHAWTKVRTDSWRSVAVSADGFFYGVGRDAKLWRVKLEDVAGESGWTKLNDNNWWWQVFIDDSGDCWGIGENGIIYKIDLAHADADAGWVTVRNDLWNSLSTAALVETDLSAPIIA